MTINDDVRTYWEEKPCGTGKAVVSNSQKYSLEWFERVEENRYKAEPVIHAVAQFSRHHGKKILEIGVGAGTDHLQWARSGAECYGVDLTDSAIEITKRRLELYGFESNLQRFDAEKLPFEDHCFDLVYSWGVIHHSENPQKIIDEARRVLKPGGLFIGMIYGKYSFWSFNLWIRKALLKGKPWLSLSEVIWNHMESTGTKAYNQSELKKLFSEFKEVTAKPVHTLSEIESFFYIFYALFPNQLGVFISIKSVK